MDSDEGQSTFATSKADTKEGVFDESTTALKWDTTAEIEIYEEIVDG